MTCVWHSVEIRGYADVRECVELSGVTRLGRGYLQDPSHMLTRVHLKWRRPGRLSSRTTLDSVSASAHSVFLCATQSVYFDL